jgi:hypothetical protein
MLFLANKYTIWYYSIINKAKDRTIDGYKEKHHIIPKTLGGKNNKDNIVLLTAREHFICHLLLTKMLTGQDKQKMVYALHMLSNTKNANQQLRYSPPSKLYEYQRKIFAEVHSERMKENHPLKNPIHKQTHQLSIDKRGPTSIKGIKRTESMKEKMRNKEWTQKALDNRLANCLKSAEARKGSKWSSDRHYANFQQYIEKNKHLFPKVLELHDSGLSIRQVSLNLGISWDRVKYIVDNKERLNTL